MIAALSLLRSRATLILGAILLAALLAALLVGWFWFRFEKTKDALQEARQEAARWEEVAENQALRIQNQQSAIEAANRASTERAADRRELEDDINEIRQMEDTGACASSPAVRAAVERVWGEGEPAD